MTADNPTVDDLRTVAANLRAEGHTSRAHLVDNAAAKLERLEAVEAAAREYMDHSSFISDRDGECIHCSRGSDLIDGHEEYCDFRQSAAKLAAALAQPGE
jgi:hypothetical protein